MRDWISRTQLCKRLGVFLCLLMLSQWSLAETVSLVLFPSVSVDDDIQVKDIAKISGPKELRDLVAKQVVLPIKAWRLSANKKEYLTASEVKFKIKKVLAEYRESDSVTVNVLGSSKVVLREIKNTVDPEELTVVGEKYLTDMLSKKYYYYQIDLKGTVGSIKTELSEYELVARRQDKKKLTKRECIWVDLVSSIGKIEKSVPIWFEVTAKEYLWVLTKDVRQNEHIDESILESELLDVTAISGIPYPATELAKDLRILVPSRVGRVLTDRIVSEVPAIEAGEEVVVESRVGEIVIVAVATAVNDASIGDLVRVKSTSSLEEYQAMVIDKNRVIVRSSSL